MGLVKNDWIERQELEPMYEWIEENYGDDAGEEGSESWNEAVKAFHDHCEEQERLEYEEHLREEYDYYTTLTLQDADAIFKKDFFELKAMLDGPFHDVANQTFYKMIYAHTVTIMEVYLEDIVKALIMSNKTYLENTIKNVKPFNDTAFKLSYIPLEKDGIQKFVLSKISDNLFHNIPKVLKILSGITNKYFDFPTEDICQITSKRHDIVHRNGKNKEGETIGISLSSTKEAFGVIEEFISQLRGKLFEYNF